eukprot:PLAT2516.3.p1 GENE.PLAT2516.3~~PLAT2516.3.p1  ORF type:complete len:559 (-),score=285.78 PLAT2516.3:98-1774(-)
MAEELAVKAALGLDFGTRSVRAMLLDVSSGRLLGMAVSDYKHGVLAAGDQLPIDGGSEPLPRDWALQSAQDWLDSMVIAVREALHASGLHGDAVVGMGIDFTSCTLLPAKASGQPLQQVERLSGRRHAWPKLWAHHASEDAASELTAAARESGADWLRRYGGALSSEWTLAKALQLLREDEQLWDEADVLIEGADWIPWQLTGQLRRSSCNAGYKAAWAKGSGFLPSHDFLAALHDKLPQLVTSKLRGDVLPPGSAAPLSAEWAERLALREGLPVGVGIIDAHSAVLGAGVTAPATLYVIAGTSTCHLLMAEEERLPAGISGVVRDGLLPGMAAYEAGQAAVGAAFDWFISSACPAELARRADADGVDLHELMTARASKLRAGESGVLALDWWAGNRCPLSDSGLTGVLLGVTLATAPEAIYRALLESTAFGTRLILDGLRDEGLPVTAVCAGGGLSRSPLFMQIYADVLALPVRVVGGQHASARGAAVLGATAAGVYDGMQAAAEGMAPPVTATYLPDDAAVAVYDTLYQQYKLLVALFAKGGAAGEVMPTLRKLQQ